MARVYSYLCVCCFLRCFMVPVLPEPSSQSHVVKPVSSGRASLCLLITIMQRMLHCFAEPTGATIAWFWPLTLADGRCGV